MGSEPCLYKCLDKGRGSGALTFYRPFEVDLVDGKKNRKVLAVWKTSPEFKKECMEFGSRKDPRSSF